MRRVRRGSGHKIEHLKGDIQRETHDFKASLGDLEKERLKREGKKVLEQIHIQQNI